MAHPAPPAAMPAPPAPPRPHSGAALTLRLCGAAQVLRPAQPPVALEPHAAALLALAALEPGIARERAARWLWPDSLDPRRNLRQQMLRFRQQFGRDLLQGSATLTLAEGVDTDLADASVGLPLLGNTQPEGCDDELATWLAQQRQALQHRALAPLRAALAEAEAAGELDSALTLAEQMLVRQPDSESHHRALMRLHYLRGDSVAGLAAYQRLVQQLASGPGVPPDPQTEQLARALREASPPVQPVVPRVAPTLLRPPRLVGRQRELAAVHEAWASQQVAWLAGEAGMGKSRLIDALCQAEPQPARIARAQGRPGDAGVPYATLARLLRGLPAPAQALPAGQRQALACVLPELDPPHVPGAQVGQLAVLQAAVRAWLAQADPALLVLDDLHFADPASLQMLAWLASDTSAGQRRWLLARRPAEGDAAVAELQDTLADGAHLAEVPLQPLDLAAMTELVASLQLPQLDATTLAPQLVRHTGGNPLFALETLKAHLLRGGSEGDLLPRPLNVGTLITRRLRQLSPQALALARVAAVAGTDFDIAAAECVLGAHTLALADAWAELEAAQVLRDGSFAHDLVQDAVLQGLPQPVAQRLHAQLAQHLQTREQAEPARVAAHWQAAGEPLAAVPWLVRASERALASLQQIVAGDLLLAASQALADGGRRAEAFELLQRCAELWLDLTDAERALALRERMLALAEGDAQQARAHLMDARVHELAGHMTEMRLSAERALVQAQRCGDLALQARGLDFLASEAFWAGRVAEALPLFERMRGLWSTLGRLSELTRCNYAIGVALQALGRLDEADANFEGAAVQLESIADWATLVQLLRERALLRINMGQRAQAAAFLQQALQLLSRIEPSAELACAPTALLARVLRRSGRYVDALALLDDFEARFAQHRTAAFWDVPLERAALLLELGRPHLALQAMAPLAALAALPQPSAILRYRLQQLRLWLREAGTEVGDDDPAVQEQLPPLLAMAVRRAAARLKPAAERVDDLQAMHAQSLQRNQRAEALGLQADLVQALHDAGRAEEAAELARPLWDALATVDALIYPPAAWWAVHQALAAHQPDIADAALVRATDWLASALRNQVPDTMLKSFVERNPLNRRLLATARLRPAASASVRAVLRATE